MKIEKLTFLKIWGHTIFDSIRSNAKLWNKLCELLRVLPATWHHVIK